MRKEAWTFTITTAVLGAFGLLMRWLQCQNIFEAETGLAARGSGLSTMMVVLLALVAAGLWWLSARMSLEYSSPEPEEALAPGPRLAGSVLIAGAVIAAGGSALMFFSASSLLFRLTALLGLVSAAVLALTPSLPRWGGFGAALSVIPVLFFSLWLVAYYKENSVNPVLWAYAMQILAISGVLLAVFRVCGYMFFRMKPRATLFACGLGTVLGLTTLMDRAETANRLILAGWAVGLCVLGWLLLDNLHSPKAEN